MLDLFRSKGETKVYNDGTASTSSNTWLAKKKHFRDTEEWKVKKTRILNKLRALSKINLALVLSRMPVCLFSISFLLKIALYFLKIPSLVSKH
ncbi:hypothetical protein CAEBREN_21355 [Caenorhabditis brenneri]|uniref:Uncharacterized protein n=1 Tax=Caenorhabditis brenneri TaxID=135651 RepID=G0MSL0_CAEBE|nr:hypothetical protein CAEBREN_21355 [Caenorhabditis brenneri]